MFRVPPTHAKAAVSAVVSALIAGLSPLLTALQGEHSGFDTVTVSQWITVAIAFLLGLGLTGHATAPDSERATKRRRRPRPSAARAVMTAGPRAARSPPAPGRSTGPGPDG